VWNVLLYDSAIDSLVKFSTSIESYSADLKHNDATKVMFENVRKYCSFLVTLFKQKLSRKYYPIGKSPLKLEKDSLDSLSEWAINDAITNTRLFAIPLLNHLVCLKDNWDVCSSFIFRILNKLQDKPDFKLLLGLIAKWLINICCSRIDAKQIDLPSIAFKRMWCTHILGVLSIRQIEVVLFQSDIRSFD
jgi:hypothetical protein